MTFKIVTSDFKIPCSSAAGTNCSIQCGFKNLERVANTAFVFSISLVDKKPFLFIPVTLENYDRFHNRAHAFRDIPNDFHTLSSENKLENHSLSGAGQLL